jgi:hypothetical protein
MIGSLVALVLLNVWTVRRVLRDEFLSPGQRRAQILIVWLIPFLGALLTLHMMRTKPEKFAGRYTEASDPGDDYGYLRPRHRRSEQTTETDAGSSGEGGAAD